jgi:hypothetical protein
MPGHHGGGVSLPPSLPFPLTTFMLLIGSAAGHFPCKSPISLDQPPKSPSVAASGGIEVSVSTSPCSKRTRTEDADDGLGRVEEESRTPQAKESEAGGGEHRSSTAQR